MAENSKIEWTDHTFNPWIGCSKVHEGCRHCYAEHDFDLRRGKAKWGVNGTRVVTSNANWAKPYRWNKAAEQCGVRAKVFCASLADVFEDWQGAMTCHKTGEGLAVNANGHVWPTGWPSFGDGDDCGVRPFTMNDARRRLFDMIDSTPWLDWLLLTKRPENVVRMWPGAYHRPNVWLGTSISDQASANKQIPHLLQCRDLCPVLGVSAEPLLGPVRLDNVTQRLSSGGYVGGSVLGNSDGTMFSPRGASGRGIDWVIVGGESGPHARPMHPDWARSLRDQCHAAGVPFFFKQWGEWGPAGIMSGPDPWPYGKGRFASWYEPSETFPHSMTGWRLTSIQNGLTRAARVGKHAAGRVLDGRTWDEMPITSEVT